MIVHIILYALLVVFAIVVLVISDNKITELKFEILRKDTLINRLKNSVKFWENKCLVNGCEAQAKIELCEKYEQIIDKFIDNRKTDTDQVFMFEGKLYMPVSFTFNRTHGELDTLDVEFTGMYIPPEEGEKE